MRALSLRTPAGGLARLAFSAKVRDSGALSVCGTNGRGLGLARDEMLNKLRHPLSEHTTATERQIFLPFSPTDVASGDLDPLFRVKDSAPSTARQSDFLISRRERW